MTKQSSARIISRLGRSISTLNSSSQMCMSNAGIKFPNVNNVYSKSPLHFQKRFFGGYLEEYYTTSNASTGFSTPLRSLFIYSIVVLQTALVFGTLFHTNYYFTGRILPKADGNTQLCSDM